MHPDSSQRLLSIQALRAVAAAAVVAYHVLFMLVHNAGYSFHVPTIGASGVDLFFVISGFIMVYTTRGFFGQPRASVRFIQRRAIRIVPLYWACTTGTVLLLLMAPALFTDVRFDLRHSIFSFVFLLSRNSAGQVGTVLQTGWTLCFEAYFYLLFAVLLNGPRRYFMVGSGLVFAVGIALGTLEPSWPIWTTAATDPLLLEFYLGCGIASLVNGDFYLPRLQAALALALGVAIIIATRDVDFGKWTRPVCWGAPGGLILYGAVSLERAGIPVPRSLAALGNSSYSLYLSHPFLVPAFGKAWVALGLSGRVSPVILFLIAFCSSIAAGHVMYLLVEAPMTRLLSGRKRHAEPVTHKSSLDAG